MPPCLGPAPQKSRLGVLLDHLAAIDDPRDVRRIAHLLAEVLLLVVCATLAPCDDCDHIAAWARPTSASCAATCPTSTAPPAGAGSPSQVNRINPALLSAAFTAWVREAWPNRPEFVAIDGKTSRRSHDRAEGAAPLHLVSAFATIATAIQDAGADYLLAVKANQPTLRAEVKACFAAALPGTVTVHTDHDKRHGRIEQRTTSLMREVDCLSGQRRFPGELRLPGVACIVRVQARIERSGTLHTKTRTYVSSADLDAERAGQVVRGHCPLCQ